MNKSDMENAIKIIEESEWLKEHDAEVISDERAKFVEWLHENYTVNDNHNEEVSVEDLLWEYSQK